MQRALFCLICSACLVIAHAGATNQAARAHGVLATFEQNGRFDTKAMPNFALYVAPTDAPAAFLRPGPFSAEFRGALTVELRGQYQFSAEASGDLELLINGASILKVSGEKVTSELTKPVRLNRGTNEVSVRYSSPRNGDARFQVFWLSKTWPQPVPLPLAALTFDETNQDLVASSRWRSGLSLMLEYRCARCHLPEQPSPEANDWDAPDFAAIGSRLNMDWIAQRVFSPDGGGRRAHMPRIFSGEDAEQKARVVAAYLATLTGDESGRGVPPDGSGGEELYLSLGCAACHATDDPALKGLAKKFRPGMLAAYLRSPQSHYAWNPMPDFHLSAEEAANLASYLTRDSSPAAASLPNPGDVAEGKRLVESSGCLNCHRGPLENRFTAPGLPAIAKSPGEGCLRGTPGAPQFKFPGDERQALQAFLKKGDFEALSRKAPADRAARELSRLACGSCHDKVEGVPSLAGAGAKLRPEWTERFLAGSITGKPRPWLKMRMPAFPATARALAQGLAALHGVPPRTDEEGGIDSQKSQLGAKLVSAAGGFGCVACHAVGSFSSGQVVESPGPNLAFASERLLPVFFHRWVMNPVVIEPGTKMPVYFDEQGRSQLIDVLDGDGTKQIDAIWAYLRLGPQMPAPPVP